MSNTDILSIECPYTSCGAAIGTVCINARTGKPLPHGHADRKKALRARANAGYRVEMSYNAWQIVRLVACSMLCETSDYAGEAGRLGDLLNALPTLNFHKPAGRTRKSYPKNHRQQFSGALLATLKTVMEQAGQLKGGTFENTCVQISNRARKIPDNAIDLLGTLAS